jgi:uncharacterized coiled-coil protein SlyX
VRGILARPVFRNFPGSATPRIHRLDFRGTGRQNPSMPDEMERRMEKLESHVAHLEHQVEQLNDVVTEQSKLVEFLKKQVQKQSGVLETMELERIKATNAKPPHYQ